MAAGLLERSPADVGVSITGIAGPGGGSPGNLSASSISAAPAAARHLTLVEKRFGDLGRTKVRLAAVAVALDLLLQAAGAP